MLTERTSYNNFRGYKTKHYKFLIGRIPIHLIFFENCIRKLFTTKKEKKRNENKKLLPISIKISK